MEVSGVYVLFGAPESSVGGGGEADAIAVCCVLCVSWVAGGRELVYIDDDFQVKTVLDSARAVT